MSATPAKINPMMTPELHGYWDPPHTVTSNKALAPATRRNEPR